MILDGWKTFRLIRSGLSSSHWHGEKIRFWQEHKLRCLLYHAYENVPLYRALYDEKGFHPKDFRTLDDLEKIPLLKKDRLLRTDSQELVSREFNPSALASVVTSGSSGHPLRIFLSPQDARWQRAVAWRILFEHGFRWTDRTMEIRMTPGENFLTQALGIAPKSWMSLLSKPEIWLQALEEKRHRVLVASAGTLRAMAETSLALDMDYPRPQLVISDGETLTPQTRALIRHVFHTDPVDVYGLVELSNFAWQCEMRQGYHVSADSHIVELVATTKGTGNIIVTALGMWAMPFIRYDTGDVGELQAEPCSCGRNSPVLSGIYGRAIDSILLPDGQKLFWPFFHEILGTYSEIKQWRVIQTDLSNLRVEFIVATESSTPDERLGQDLRQVLPCDMTINLTQVKEIPTQPGGKSRMVISSLSSSTF